MKAVLITPSVTQLYKTNEFHPTAPGELRSHEGGKTAKLREVSAAQPGGSDAGPRPSLRAGVRSGAGCRMRRGRTGSPRETLRASARWDEQAVSLRSE